MLTQRGTLTQTEMLTTLTTQKSLPHSPKGKWLLYLPKGKHPQGNAYLTYPKEMLTRREMLTQREMPQRKHWPQTLGQEMIWCRIPFLFLFYLQRSCIQSHAVKFDSVDAYAEVTLCRWSDVKSWNRLTCWIAAYTKAVRQAHNTVAAVSLV